jgi:hypothetical protein
MLYISVIHSVCIFLPTSEFRRALARPKALECLYYPCPTLTYRASVLRLARIWLVASYVSCHLVDMMTLLTAFAVVVAAVVEAFCREG